MQRVAENKRLEFQLQRVVAFQSVAVENLQPVVLERIVRRADDHARAAVKMAGEKSDRGRRDHAEKRHRDAHRRHALSHACSSIGPERRVSRPITTGW